MKKNKFKEELKQFSSAELKEKLEGLRRELFGVQLNAKTSHVEDYSQFKKLKKNIARVETYLKQATQVSQV